VGSLFNGSVGTVIGMIVTGIIGGFIGGGVGSLFGPLGGPIGGLVGSAAGLVAGAIFGSKILGLIATAIAYIIITIAVLSALFRVWFMLIKAYVYILLDVIFAPFWIIGGILPGAPGGVGPWLRSLVSNLAAFPAVIVLFMIGRTIQEQVTNDAGNFIPPLIGNPGHNSGEAIGSLIGLGIILIMPEAVNITKSALKAPELKYTAAVGRAIGQGQGFVSKPVGSAWQQLTGKRTDGTYGPLRSLVEDRAAKAATKLGLHNTRIGKAYLGYRAKQQQRRREHMFGNDKTTGTDKNNEDPNNGEGTNPRPTALVTPPAGNPEAGAHEASTETEDQRRARIASDRAAREARGAREASEEARDIAREINEELKGPVDDENKGS
jgi:hypothetical protein